MSFNYLDILPDDILNEIFNETANKIEKDIELAYFIVRFCKVMTDNTEEWSDHEDYKHIYWFDGSTIDTLIFCESFCNIYLKKNNQCILI